jgi:polysaccharide export outer membrane protein
MNRLTKYSVLALTCCLAQQGLVVAVAQQQQSRVAVVQTETTATTKSGIADGAWSPALTGERRPLYRLRPSDVIDVNFTFSPEFNQTVAVQPDGFITLTGVRALYVEGATLPELQEAIGQRYSNVLHDPEVTIVLKDFDKPYFTASGEVARPGKYELRSDVTVSEAVAIAGGFTPRSKHSQVVLFRRVSGELMESHLLNVKSILKSRRLDEDVHLQPGDLLFVPQNVISKLKQFLPVSNVSMYVSSNQF